MARCKTLTKAAGKYSWEPGVEVDIADKNDLKELVDGGYVQVIEEAKPAAKAPGKASTKDTASSK